MTTVLPTPRSEGEILQSANVKSLRASSPPLSRRGLATPQLGLRSSHRRPRGVLLTVAAAASPDVEKEPSSSLPAPPDEPSSCLSVARERQLLPGDRRPALRRRECRRARHGFTWISSRSTGTGTQLCKRRSTGRRSGSTQLCAWVQVQVLP